LGTALLASLVGAGVGVAGYPYTLTPEAGAGEGASLFA
jgi:hypothetical protein